MSPLGKGSARDEPLGGLGSPPKTYPHLGVKCSQQVCLPWDGGQLPPHGSWIRVQQREKNTPLGRKPGEHTTTRPHAPPLSPPVRCRWGWHPRWRRRPQGPTEAGRITALPGLLGDLWQMSSNRDEQTQLHTAADPSALTFMLCGQMDGEMDGWTDGRMNGMCAQSCPTLCNPLDCSPPGSSAHGILQARILEWAAIPSSRGSSDPGIEPTSLRSPALAGGLFTAGATWEALLCSVAGT